MYHPERLVLASASPRRADLLTAAGFHFDVVPAMVDERRLADEAPGEYAQRVAASKVAAVAAGYRDRPVLGADTIVVIDDLVLGKPVDAVDAAAMLARIAGRTHEVITGVALRQGNRLAEAIDVTRVTLVPLTRDEIDRYVATGEPMDKAGAYAAQGLAARYVERVDGSYTNVVGLPLALVDRLFRQLEPGAH